MIKNFFLLVAIFSFSATTLSAQDLLDKLAEASCSCISQKSSDNLSSDELQIQMGFCIMEAVGKYPEDFQKQYGNLDFTDQQAMTKLGEDIGMRMAFKCPDVLMKMAAVETETTVTTTTVSNISGTLRAIEGDDFSQLVVEDESGRKHKLLWLGYFNGSEQLIEDQSRAIGRRVNVSYETVECYSPKANDYINCKEIKALSFE